MNRNGADAIVDGLVAHGVDTVFSLPGGQLDHLFDAIYRRKDGPRIIQTRHEQGAAYMAYGYARSTGKVGCFAVVPGPGLLNTGAALCTAWANYAPVLAISGQVPSGQIDRGYGELHEIPDQLGMIRHITKWAKRIERVEETEAVMAEAFAQLSAGAPRPVEIEMSMDVMGQSQTGPSIPSLSSRREAPAADSTALSAAIEALANARKPLIYIGSGAFGAGEVITKLAEVLQAPVASFRAGKGIVAGSHPLAVNHPLGHRLWGEADVVLALGTRLHWPLVMWGKDEQLTLIRVDIDSEQIDRICVPDIGIHADAGQVAAALLAGLQTRDHQAQNREADIANWRSEMDTRIRHQVAPQMAYLDAIRAALPADGFFVDEVTQVGFASWYGFSVEQERQHVSAGYQGTLGFGYATALGVVAGNPGKKVVQISGDGGFLFTMQEMATAVQYQLPLVSIVFNDHRFTNVQRQQQEWFDGRVHCSDLHNPDFKALATSFGMLGMRVDTPDALQDAIQHAFAAGGPALIEVEVNEFLPTPWPFLMLPQNRKAVCT